MSMINKLRRNARNARDESGSTLIAVIGVMAFAAVLTVTLGTMSINGLNYTSASGAAIQAEAAAQAGIDSTLAQLKGTGTCVGSFTSTSQPVFTTSVWSSTATTITAATAWSAGCPTASTNLVKVVSVGSAAVPGRAGTSSGNRRSVEAIYKFAASTSSVPPSGSASYSYSAGTDNNLTLLTTGTLTADIRIHSGSVTCQSGTTVAGNVYLGGGNWSSSGSCKVTGNVSASGTVSVISGAEVTGNISAAGTGATASDQVAYVSGTGASGQAVGGNVAAAGLVYVDGKVGGSVTSAGLQSGAIANASTVTPSSKVLGSAAAAGTWTTWATPRCSGSYDAADNACVMNSAHANLVSGAVTYGGAGLVKPIAPTVPQWADYKYSAADWTALGFNVVVWPNDTAHCTIDNNWATRAWDVALTTYTTPTVIDATACADLDFSQSANLNLSLKTNLVFVSNSIDIGKLTANSDSATQRSLWFIVPDKTPDHLPSCVPDGTIDIKNLTNIGSTVSAMAYSPCTISNSAATWSGQMYGGTVNFDTSITLTYRPVGLPNLDLDTGAAAAPATPASGLGARVSIRDVQ